MEFDLKVHDFNGTVEEFMETDEFKEFTSHVSKYYDAVYAKCKSITDNETQFKIFDDWWNGKRLWEWVEELKTHIRAPQYQEYSEEDWLGANGLIQIAVCAGCG